MVEEKKKKALWVGVDTHKKVAIMAATKQVSIKQCLKELVEKAEKEQGEK